MKKIILPVAALLSTSLAFASDWTELRGFDSLVAAPHAIVAKTPAEWASLWREHAGGSAELPALKPGESVVAVFLGEQSRGGATLEIAVEPDPALSGGYVARVRRGASSGSLATAVIARPFVMRRVQSGAVRLEGFAASSISAGRLSAPAQGEAPGRLDRLRDAVRSLYRPLSFDGAAARSEGVGAVLMSERGADASSEGVINGGVVLALAQLPPPADQQPGKPLPPPVDQPRKPLPPPVDQPSKPLPPPVDQPSKPLPPPAENFPRPGRDGQLPGNDDRLRYAAPAPLGNTSGMRYLGYWELDSSGWQAATGRVVTKPQDNGSYLLTLDSHYIERTRDFYHNGANYYYVDHSKDTASRSKRITVDFVNRASKPLLPWESEEFVFSYTGQGRGNGTVDLRSHSGAYRYTYGVFFDPSDPLSAEVQMTAYEKKLTPADSGAVGASIAPDGSGGLKLVLTDRWAGYYAGETLEITLQIRKDDGSRWKRDPIVFEAKANSPLQARVPAVASIGQSASMEIQLGVPGSGKFYVENWQFRRAGSQYSTGDWHYKGNGNTITK